MLLDVLGSFRNSVARCDAEQPPAGTTAAPVGVEQRLARIETKAMFGSEGTKRAIRVELFRSDSGHENMPVVVGTVGARIELDYACRVGGGGIIEQQEVHPGCKDPIDDVSANRDLGPACVRGGHDQRLALGFAGQHLPVDSGAAPSGQRGSS
jgi:hypothetical protein